MKLPFNGEIGSAVVKILSFRQKQHYFFIYKDRKQLRVIVTDKGKAKGKGQFVLL